MPAFYMLGVFRAPLSLPCPLLSLLGRDGLEFGPADLILARPRPDLAPGRFFCPMFVSLKWGLEYTGSFPIGRAPEAHYRQRPQTRSHPCPIESQPTRKSLLLKQTSAAAE